MGGLVLSLCIFKNMVCFACRILILENTAVSSRLNLIGQSSVMHSYSTCSASIDFTARENVSLLEYKSSENMTSVPVVSFWTHYHARTMKGCYLNRWLALNMRHVSCHKEAFEMKRHWCAQCTRPTSETHTVWTCLVMWFWNVFCSKLLLIVCVWQYLLGLYS